MSKKLVLFDFNGTLIHDAGIIYDCARQVFHDLGKDPPTIAEYYRAYTAHWTEVYRQLGIDESRETINELYNRAYSKYMQEIRSTHGAADTLRALQTRGIKIGIVTLQQRNWVMPLLFKHFFGIIFDHVYLKETGGEQKTESMLEALDREAVRAEDALFVGDTPSDIIYANRAGIAGVAYLNGYVPEDLFVASEDSQRNAQPAHVIRSMARVLDIASV